MNQILDYIRHHSALLKKILTVLSAFTVFFVGILFLFVNLNTQDSNLRLDRDFENLESNWQIRYEDGTSLDNVEMPYWIKLSPNTKAYISTTIPDDSPLFNTIVTRNYHQELVGFVDSEEIYHFPSHGDASSNFIITDDWNAIFIPEGSSGKTFTMELISGNAGYEGYLEAPYFGENNAILGHLKSKYAIPYGLSISLIFIGILILIIAAIYTREIVEMEQILMGTVFIAVGIWFADRSKMPVFMVGSNVKFFLAFMCLLMVPLLLFLLISIRFPTHNKKITTSFILSNLVFIIASFIVTAIKQEPIYSVIPLAYLFILVACIYFSIFLARDVHGKQAKELNRVELTSARIELTAAIMTLFGSFLSILYDAISTNNWSLTQREWSGVGNIQMVSINIFALALLVVLVYKSYHGALDRELIQSKLHNSQLQLMMGQIQPHFMFNTLSSIRTLIKVDADTAYKMVYDFSNYLRANVDNITNLDGIKFAAEVEHIKSYTGIEQVRFGDRLDVLFDIKVSDFMVPPLSIQPLVENAIKHGVMKKVDGGTVWLRSYSTPEFNVVEVEDDGVGIKEERMQMLFGEGDFDESSQSINEDDRMTIKELLSRSSLRDGGGKLKRLDVTLPDVDLSGNGSEVHRSTGLKNILLRLKEISNATMEISSQENKGTLIKVFFPKS